MSFSLPSDMGEDLIFALLGEYHIIGRKDWGTLLTGRLCLAKSEEA